MHECHIEHCEVNIYGKRTIKYNNDNIYLLKVFNIMTNKIYLKRDIMICIVTRFICNIY